MKKRKKIHGFSQISGRIYWPTNRLASIFFWFRSLRQQEVVYHTSLRHMYSCQQNLHRWLHWKLSKWQAKCHHIDNIFDTDCTGCCQNANFRCSQSWKFLQDGDISISVLTTHKQLCTMGRHGSILDKVWGSLSSSYQSVIFEDLCARSRYQGQGQVITAHIF